MEERKRREGEEEGGVGFQFVRRPTGEERKRGSASGGLVVFEFFQQRGRLFGGRWSRELGLAEAMLRRGRRREKAADWSFSGQQWPKSMVVRVRGRIKEERKRRSGYGVFRSKSLTGEGGRRQVWVSGGRLDGERGERGRSGG
ncbi:hypothetical protein HAX54_017879, partial [Datura stramonium]|nr:hypothetical protein [Datura stramonium]